METHFASGPEGLVAYQVWGDGPVDVLLVPAWLWTVELMWEDPRIERFLRRLGSFSRVIAFDKRGTGVSDPVPLGAFPTLEQWADDIRVVLDAVGSQHAALIGNAEGAQMAILFAGLHPERTQALVSIDGVACYLRRDDYPIGIPETLYPTAASAWSVGGRIEVLAPTLAGDERFVAWWRRFQRVAVSPSVLPRMFLHGRHWDVRPALETISAPTLVIHRQDNRYLRADGGKYVADHVSGARYVELEGSDCLFFAGDQDAIIGEIEHFLTGAQRTPEPDRVLATVLFTDVVSSTEHAARVGDQRWHDLMDLHDRLAVEHVARFRGRVIKQLGDGILATFDGPGRALQCAATIAETVRSIGLECRAGLHTGEVELRGEDIAGIAVHIAARVAAQAQANEVLVSGSIPPLVIGSRLTFDERGEYELKGVPGAWKLYALAQNT